MDKTGWCKQRSSCVLVRVNARMCPCVCMCACVCACLCGQRTWPSRVAPFWSPDTLEVAARAFCSSTEVTESPKPQIKLSQIFEWYAADFAPEGESASAASTLKFVGKYLPADQQAAVERITVADAKGALSFVPYDWGLNSK